MDKRFIFNITLSVAGGICVLAAMFSDMKWLYFLGGGFYGFLFGVYFGVNRLFKRVQGRKMTSDEEEAALNELL